MESAHLGIQYPCDRCHFKTSCKALLKRHVESEHLHIQYPCDKCEYNATQKGSLKRHVKSAKLRYSTSM